MLKSRKYTRSFKVFKTSLIIMLASLFFLIPGLTFNIDKMIITGTIFLAFGSILSGFALCYAETLHD